MNRRQFLASLGIGASSLFLPSLLRGAKGDALAYTDQPPQRLLIFYTRHGVWGEPWVMDPEGLGSNLAWSSDLSLLAEDDFSRVLSPLYRFRDRMSVVEGLSLLSAEADITGQRHELGQVHSLTGSPVQLMGGVPLGSSASVDQVIADQIARADRFRSLELAVGLPENSVIYRGGLQVAPYESNPSTLFRRIFGAENSVEEAVLAAQGSVLDRVAERYERLGLSLGQADREKLQIHQQLVRELELRVEGMSSLACNHSIDEPTGGEGYNETFEAMASMIATALSCDITRVISLNMGEIPVDELVDGYSGSLHFDFAHNAFNDELSAEVMAQYGKRHSEQLASLLDLLDSIPEAGGSVLDNTLAVWVSELGDPAHGYDRYNAVMVGGNRMKHGKYHHFPSTLPYDAWSWDGGVASVGPPHQKLLTTICRAMGLNVDSFGQEGVIGSDGVEISLKGWLENLT